MDRSTKKPIAPDKYDLLYLEELAKLNRTVDEFTKEMKKKLTEKASKGWHGWEDLDFIPTLKGELLSHALRVEEGQLQQAVDVANLAMFLWRFRGE